MNVLRIGTARLRNDVVLSSVGISEWESAELMYTSGSLRDRLKPTQDDETATV